MKFKYTGDPMQPTEAKNLPETFFAFGVTFDRNKYAEVPDDVGAPADAGMSYVSPGYL